MRERGERVGIIIEQSVYFKFKLLAIFCHLGWYSPKFLDYFKVERIN